MYTGGRTPELLEELKVIEFGGQLLDHINRKTNMVDTKDNQAILLDKLLEEAMVNISSS